MTIAVAVAAAKTSTGNQDITTSDLGGLTPKAALFLYSRGAADGTGVADGVGSFGACDGTSQWAIASFVQDAAGTPALGTVGKTSKCVTALHLDTGTVQIHSEAAFSSFITNGVRINWTTAQTDAWLLTVVLFAGTDWTVKAGTAVSVANASVNVGFEPTAVLFGGVIIEPIATSRALYSMGAQAWSTTLGRTGAVNWTWSWAFSSNQDESGVSAGAEGSCGAIFEVGFGGQYAIRVDKNPTGFTFDPGFQNPNTWGYLALEWTGGSAYCALLEVTAATGAQSFTGFGLTPDAALFFPSGNTANGTPQFGRKCGAVAATLTKAGGFATASRSDGMGGNYIEKSTACEDTLRVLDQTGSTVAAATVQSFDPDGLTLDVTDAPPVTWLWPVIAFGPSSSGGERTFGWIID